MKRRGGPSQQSHPLALIAEDVSQLLTHQVGVAEIVAFADQSVPKLDLLRSDNQMRLQSIQNGRQFEFRQQKRGCHAPIKIDIEAFVQLLPSFFNDLSGPFPILKPPCVKTPPLNTRDRVVPNGIAAALDLRPAQVGLQRPHHQVVMVVHRYERAHLEAETLRQRRFFRPVT